MTVDYKKYAPQLLAIGYPEMAVDEPQYMGMNDMIEAIWKTRIDFDYDASEPAAVPVLYDEHRPLPHVCP